MTEQQFNLLITELRLLRQALIPSLKGLSPRRLCPYCGTPFQRRDAKAKFCCDEHRVRFNSLKRTPPKTHPEESRAHGAPRP